MRAQASVADLLWPHDEEAAREMLRGTQASLVAAAASVTADDPRYQQHAQTANNLRREVVFAVANRDPKFALEMLRATRLAAPAAGAGRNPYRPDAELELETQLAEQVAARDPKEAVRMAEESLAKGVSGNLPGVVERIRASDPQAASRLAADIVRRLRATNLATNYEAANVASYLLRASRPPDAPQQSVGPQAAPGGAGAPFIVGAYGPQQGQLALDDQTRRDLITALVNSALAPGDAQGRGRGNGRQLYGTLQQLMPEIERLMPAQAAALRRRIGEGNRAAAETQDPRARWREYESLMNTGTADALIDAAGKAPAEMRQSLYRAAAFKALNDGNAERARQIATAHFEGGQQREGLLREIDQQLFWRASQSGDVEAARELLARFRSPEERMGMLLSLARSLTNYEGKRDVIERLLEEVWGQAGGRARNQSQFAMQLQVAQTYAPFAPARAFEIMESCVEQLNELLAAAAVVDGFGQESFEQGELKAEGGYIWSVLVQQSGEQLGQLAGTDFDRAAATADRLQRPEARLRARLLVARGVLARGAGRGVPGRRFGMERRNRAGIGSAPGRNVPQR
ncbi:MAG: hypothetical protein LC800_17430 [Acidobacteria bacterium]|nr:hypothetical protein [Acidobacteriota bacterium]